jgi:transcriptional regulator with XRE-family HTH domain
MAQDFRKETYARYERLRKEKGVTDYEVSQKTGISTATLSSWKNGIYTPKIEKFRLLAKYFDIPVTYFIEE